MKAENAIEVYDLKKMFKVYADKGVQLKERILFRKRNKYEEHWVLNGVTFEIKKGEVVGLIGHNGCGKSTTLKLLTKIIYPDKGTVDIQGRVSSLIELGAGFHPDMSGRENIYTNAAIFGLTRKEIDERIDEIIAFSELGDYINNPVRTYSSGMYARLAFSVAINVDADVLLVDEILSVGDANFQHKCFNKLREIKARGTTIVIVSHSLGQIEQICDRTIWIDQGVVRMEGDPRKVDVEYLDYMANRERDVLEVEAEEEIIEISVQDSLQEESDEEIGTRDYNIPWINEHGMKEKGNKQVELISVQIKNGKVFRVGSDIEIEIKYKRRDNSISSAVLGMNIVRNDGMYCYGTTTFIDRCEKWKLKDNGTIRVMLKNVPLLAGIYNMDIALSDGVTINYHYLYEALQFEIRNPYDELGVFRIEHEWNWE